MAKKMMMDCFARVYKVLTSRLSQVSIKKKLLFSGMITLLITSVVISSVLIHQSYRLMMDKTAVQTRSSLEQVVNGYEQMLVRQYSVLESLKNYEPLYEYMDEYFPSDYDAYSAFMRSVWPGLKLISSSVREMDIRLYSDRSNGKFSHLTSGSLEELDRATWFSADMTSHSDVRWEGDFSAAEGKRRLTCSLILQRTRQGEPRMLATVFFGRGGDEQPD